MDVRNVPIHRLRLSQEVKTRGYQRPDAQALSAYQELGPLYPCIVTRVHSSPTSHSSQRSIHLRNVDEFEILAQEEVWFAAQSLGIDKIPVLEIDASDDQQREQFFGAPSDDNPIAKAEHYHRWLNETDLYLQDPEDSEKTAPHQKNKKHATQSTRQRKKASTKKRTITALAKLEGCTRSNISHQLRLLTLEIPIQHLLRANLLTTAHGKELLKHKPEEGRVLMAVRAAEHQWSVLELKKHLKEQRSRHSDKTPLKKKEKDDKKDRETERLEQRLTELLGSPVRLNVDAGVLEINYMKNLDVLDGILNKVGYRG